MNEMFFSKKINKWISFNKCEEILVTQKPQVIKGYTGPNKIYLYHKETDEFIKDSYKIKYACNQCGSIHELNKASFDDKIQNWKKSICLSCIQIDLSNRPKVKEKKRQAVINRSPEYWEKHKKIRQSKEYQEKRIKNFKISISNQSENRRKEIRESKQKTWANKSEEELIDIMNKAKSSGVSWKKFKTKFGEISCQGYEDSVLIEFLNFDKITNIQRGPCIKMSNGRNHFPDFKISIKEKDILIEVKSFFLYKKYKKEIEYKKEEAIKQNFSYHLIVLNKRSDATHEVAHLLQSIL